MTRTLEILAIGIGLGLLVGIPFGFWLSFELRLSRRATGQTITFERPRIGA